LSHSCPHTRKKEIKAIRRTERVKRRGRERRSDVITEVFKSRTKLRHEKKL